MQNDALKKSLPVVARTISERHKGKLEVVVGGDTACTNGGTIFLPALPDNEEAKLLARGYIDHEAAHIRHTNFKIPNDPMTNALEDVRIEKQVSGKFLGAKHNLKALTRWYVENGGTTVSEDDSDHDILAKYVHFRLRRDVLDNFVGDLVDKAKKELVSRFDEDIREKADEIIRPALRSTKDASQRAEKLRALLKEKQKEHGRDGQGSEEGQDDQDSPGQAGQAGISSGETGGELGSGQSSQPGGQQDSQEDQSESEKDNGSDSGREKDEPAGSSGADGTAGSGQPDASPDDSNESGQSDASDQAGDESGKGAGGNFGQQENSGDQAMEANFRGLGELVAKDLEKMSRQAPDKPSSRIYMPSPQEVELCFTAPYLYGELQESKVTSAQMRRKLQGALEAKRRDRVKTGRSGKKFSKNNLHRLAVKDTRIFTRKIEHKAVNTAVHILLDRSSSMKGRDMEIAVKTCYSLALALENMKYVNLAVSAYPGKTEGYVLELKRFQESVKLEKFAINAFATTPTAESMMYAAYTLAFQKEPRKIIFVITDGRPNNPAAVKDMEKWATKYGVEVFGLGIGWKEVADTFTESIVVDRIEELAQAIFKALGRKL